MIISLISMFLLGAILACCLCAMFILTREPLPTEKELDELRMNYNKKENAEK